MKKEILLAATLLITISFHGETKAELYAWTDEKGVKHYSNTVIGQDAKNVRRIPEEKFDKEEYFQYMLKQQALEEQQRIKEEKELREREIEAANRVADEIKVNQLQQSLQEQERIRAEKELKEKEIEATNRLADEIAKSNLKKERLKRLHEEANNSSATNGAINPITGEFLVPSGQGYVGTKDGTFYTRTAGGVINTKTGQFIPVTK